MPLTNLVSIELHDLRSTCCLGVAGNFAGHLEQAGEASDFVNVRTEAERPKGIFPWYVPGWETFLGAFPLSSDALAMPDPQAAPGRIQLEPELAVACDVIRDGNGALRSLTPRWIAAFDDCSLRRPGARRISEKKNWGAGSKGLAARGWSVQDLDPAGDLASLRLACFLRRGDETHAYGVDSEIATYTLFGDALLEWLVDRLAHQRGDEETPLEDVGALLDASGASQVLVGVGATRYEPYGETTFVEVGDEAIVVVYDSNEHAPGHVATCIAQRRDAELSAASVLRRVAR